MESKFIKFKKVLEQKRQYIITVAVAVAMIITAVIVLPGMFAKAEVSMTTTKKVILKLLNLAEVPHEYDQAINTNKGYKTGFVDFAGGQYWVVHTQDGTHPNKDVKDGGWSDAVTLYAKKGYLYYPFYRNNSQTIRTRSVEDNKQKGFILADYSSSDIRAYLSQESLYNDWLKDGNAGCDGYSGHVSGFYAQYAAGVTAAAYNYQTRLYDGTATTTFKEDFFTKKNRLVDWNSVNTSLVGCGSGHADNKDLFYNSVINEKFFLTDAFPDTHSEDGYGKKVLSAGPGSIRDLCWSGKSTEHWRGDGKWQDRYSNLFGSGYYVQANFWTVGAIKTNTSDGDYHQGASIRTWSWGGNHTNVNQNLEANNSKTYWSDCHNAQLIAPVCNLDLNRIVYLSTRYNGTISQETKAFTLASIPINQTSNDHVTLMLNDKEGETIKSKGEGQLSDIEILDGKVEINLSEPLAEGDKIGIIVENDTACDILFADKAHSDVNSSKHYYFDLNDISAKLGSKDLGSSFRLKVIAYQENNKGNYVGESTYGHYLDAENYLIRYCKVLTDAKGSDTSERYVTNYTTLNGLEAQYQEYTQERGSTKSETKNMQLNFAEKNFSYEKTLDWWCNDVQFKADFDSGESGSAVAKVELIGPNGGTTELKQGKFSEKDKLKNDLENEYIIRVTPKDETKYVVTNYKIDAIRYPMATLGEIKVENGSDINFNPNDPDYPEYSSVVELGTTNVGIKAVLDTDMTASLWKNGTLLPTSLISGETVPITGELVPGKQDYYIYTYPNDGVKKSPCRYKLTIEQKIAAPTIESKSKTFYSKLDVTITAEQYMYYNPEIYYTSDTTEPTRENGTLYKGPFSITQTQTIKARTYIKNNDGTYISSNVTTADYTKIKVAEPKASVESGTYYVNQNVELSCSTAKSVIYYTTDGTDPTTSSTKTKYATAVPIAKNTEKETILKAVAYVDNMPSSILTCEYTFADLSVIALPGSDIYNSDVNVSLISSTSDAVIKYTLDGTQPSRTVGETYRDVPIMVKRDENDTTVYLKTYIYLPNVKNYGVEYEFKYEFSNVGGVIEKDFVYGGTYYGTSDETITLEYNGNASDIYTIYYTDDGSDPKTEKTKRKEYTEGTAIAIPKPGTGETEKTTHIRAIACVLDGEGKEIFGNDFDETYVRAFTPPAPITMLEAGTYYNDVTTQLLCEDENAEIYWKIDSGTYTEYIEDDEIELKKVAGTTKKLYAYSSGEQMHSEEMVKSSVVTTDYTFKDVESPVGSPTDLKTYFADELTVKLSCNEPKDAYIYYTLDGSDPTEDSELYYDEEPIILSSRISSQLRAIAVALDGGKSGIKDFNYSFENVSAPEITVEGGSTSSGTYHQAKTITLSCNTEGLVYGTDYEIWYKKGAGNPLLGTHEVYDPAKKITFGKNDGEIKFNAVTVVKEARGGGNSDVTSATYNFAGDVETPKATYNFADENQIDLPQSLTYYKNFYINVLKNRNTDDVKLQYSTDGGTTWMNYTAPINKRLNDTWNTFTARCIDEENLVSAATALCTFTKGTLSAPTASVPTGTYYEAQNVTLTCADTPNSEKATIRYTTDGSDPKVTGVEVESGSTIRIAFDDNGVTLKMIAYYGEIYSEQAPDYVYTFKSIGTIESTLKETTYYTDSQNLKLNYNGDGEAAKLYYTTEANKNPETEYNDDTGITVGKGTETDLPKVVTVKAVAKIGSTYGSTTSFSYVFDEIKAPEIALKAGEYHEDQMVSLNLNSTGENVKTYYTDDGSDPTAASDKRHEYDAENPIELKMSDGNKTIKAATVASENGTVANSEVATCVYTFSELKAPIASPKPGAYTTEQDFTLKIDSATELIGAEVYYTLTEDGTEPVDPTNESTPYAPRKIFAANKTMKIKAVVYHNGTYGTIGNYEYKFETVRTPEVSPAGGTYYENQSVTVTCATQGADVYYTIGVGEEPKVPDQNSTKYTEAIPITKDITKRTCLKVKAFYNGSSSDTAINYYSFEDIAKPTATVSEGDYYVTSLNVGLKCDTVGADIYYTTEADKTPDIKYEDKEITINKPNPSETVTLKAIAVYNSGKSEMLTINYNFKDIEAIKALKGTGSYAEDIVEVLNCNTSAAQIKYTKDGKDPKTSGDVYTKGTGITISKQATPVTLRAVPYVVENGKNVYGEEIQCVYTFLQITNPISTLPEGTYYTDKVTYLSVTPSTATIRYTLNGNDPTDSSTVYTAGEAIPLAKGKGKVTLKAKAWVSDTVISDVTTCVYNFQAVETPTATPDGKEPIMDSQDVTLSCKTEGAEIYYTTDGKTTPTKNSTKYENKPITIKRNTDNAVTLKAVAYYDTGVSNVMTCTYTFMKVAAPTANVQSGTYYASQTVKLTTTTENAVIRYTLDNTEPTKESTVYNSEKPVVIERKENGYVYLKAKAFLDDKELSSDTSTWRYDFAELTVPTVDVGTGKYYGDQTITLTSERKTGTTVRYTKDGKDPTEKSDEYTAPIKITKNTKESTTLKMATFVGSASSKVVSFTYSFEEIPVPTASVSSGTYWKSLSVALTDSLPDVIIRYTLDGTEPTALSQIYTTALTVNKNLAATVELKARAFYQDGTSEVSSYKYTFVNLATPTVLPAGGTYSKAQAVTLSSDLTDSVIYYTLDGTEPTKSSKKYTETFTINPSETDVTLKVKYYVGEDASPVNTQVYKFIVNHWERSSNGSWRYLKDGEAVTGWKNDIPGWNDWFYFESDGIMATGWRNNIPGYDGWFFFQDDAGKGGVGTMLTGWSQISGYRRWFHFGSSGLMGIGWIKTTEGNSSADGLWYYMSGNFMDTSECVGWKFVDGYWYYLKPTWGGAMAADEYIDGYYVDVSGRMQL